MRKKKIKRCVISNTCQGKSQLGKRRCCCNSVAMHGRDANPWFLVPTLSLEYLERREKMTFLASMGW